MLFKEGEKPNWMWPSHFKYPMRYGFLRDVGADQIAYATQASEAVFAVSTDCEVKFDILRENYGHSDENMYVAFKTKDTSKLSYIKKCLLTKQEVTLRDLNIQFEVKHYYFNALVRAVNRIDPAIIARILPTAKSFFPFTNYPDHQLLCSMLSGCNIVIDQDQFTALHAIMSCDCRSPPLIVNGPFGTGKTRLLAATTYCIIRDGMNREIATRVLICAHHQASADHFMKDYFIGMFDASVELVRLSTTTVTSKGSVAYQDYIRSYSYRRHSNYLVIVTTFNTAPRLSAIFEPGFFSHILIDEGSQAREPDSIAPLCLASSHTKLVIAGDSCQVSPFQMLPPF